jgi:hypothetical protein
MVNAMFLHGLIGRPSPSSPIDEDLVTRLKEMNGPESVLSIPVPQRLWTKFEWTRIEIGHIAQDMDDKWHGYVEEDILHLHRSWTGQLMYEAHFESDGDVRRIVDATVRNDESYEALSPETESVQLEVIIETVFLSEWNDAKITDLLQRLRDEGKLPSE